jgi:YHS domain-containing protein
MFVGRLILILVLAFLLYRLVRFLLRLPGGAVKPSIPPRAGGSPPKSEDMVKDPCCGVYIPVSEAKCLVVEGKRLYFCSNACMETFRKGRNA